MKYNRCKWAGMVLTLMLVFPATYGITGVPLADNLAQTGERTLRSCVPLLLEVAALRPQ